MLHPKENGHFHRQVSDRFGLLPNFFCSAQAAPGLIEELWAFAQAAYLDNPLPSVFKERLFVYLSRFCPVRYCVVRHVGFLIGLGRPAGDAQATPQTLEQGIDLLSRPLPDRDALQKTFHRLESQTLSPSMPPVNTPAEGDLLEALALIFLEPRQSSQARIAVKQAYGETAFEQLTAYLAFIRTAHYWTETHPELAYEPDVVALMNDHPVLAELLLDPTEAERVQQGDALREALTNLQAAQQRIHQTQQRDTFLLQLSDALRPLTDPTHIQQAAMKLLGQHLQVSRAFYGDMQADQDTLLIGPGYARDTFPLEVQVRFSEFDADLSAYYGRGQIVVMDDVADHPLVNERSKAEFALIDCRAAVGVPLLKEGTVRGILSLHQRVPRHWTASEISLAQETAERAWAAVERAKAEAALRASQKRFESIANLVPDLLWDSEPDGATNWYNQRWLDYTGQRFDEAIGWGWTQAIHPDDRDVSARRYGQAVAAGESLRQEHRIRRHDGVYRWFVVSASPLKDQRGQVIKLYGAATDIDDIKRLEASLREADRRKDEFLAMLAHELRNPMSTIRSGLQILSLTAGDDEMMSATVTMMNRQTDHLVRLVDDLLDVSRISRGKIELHNERVDLVALVRQAVEAMQALYQEQSRNLQVDLPTNPIYVQGDATRLTQVVTNLLTNGARYTVEGGKVWLKLVHQQREAILEVRDNGIGLAADQLSAIFELFVQVDNSTARSKGGLGLGLTLVQRLVDMHRGQVQAQSEGLGKGSTFTVHLPALETAPEARRKPLDQPTSPASHERILVIDDNADAAFTLAMLLKVKGYEVHTRYSGRAGLEAAEALQPAAILLDLGMPELDGYATCRLLREHSWGGQVPVIALSGYGQDEDRERTKEAGFTAHLVKPVDLDALLNTLAQYLSNPKAN